MFKKILFLANVKTTFRNIVQKLVVGLLLISVGLLIVNNVVFVHTHKMSDGKILIHAHPYNKSQDSAPFKKHDHTSKELFQISHIQLLFVTAIFSVFSAILTANKNIYFYKIPSIHFRYCFRLKGRGPPISCNSHLYQF
jgi:hypothetical protein